MKLEIGKEYISRDGRHFIVLSTGMSPNVVKGKEKGSGAYGVTSYWFADTGMGNTNREADYDLVREANPLAAAIALLQAEGYRVEAPYWTSKKVEGQGSDARSDILAFVDRDSVAIHYGHSRAWINFDTFDAIAKVVEEAKEFNRKYRS